MPLLEGLGREVLEARVRTLAIISDFHVFEHRVSGVLPCREAFSTDGLDLEAVVPALHGGAVGAVAFLDSARNETVGLQETAIVMRTVLGTADALLSVKQLPAAG